MYEVKVATSFQAAHFITGWKGPCANVHGHSWQVEALFQSKNLNKLGMIAYPRDLTRVLNKVIADFEHRCINEVEPFNEVNPTPELLARYVFEGIKTHLKGAPRGLHLSSVSISEGSGIIATFYLKR